MSTPDNPLIDTARGRDEKPSEQLPCPFCGGRTFIDPVGRSWWRLYSWHKKTCLLSEVDHDVPQTEDQKQLLIDAWNSRTPLKALQERKPLTPDSSKVVSDEDLLRAFAGTNFGTTDYRPLLHQAVLKKACDYHCGHTITQIMKVLGLIGASGRPLKKGVNMLRIAYHEQMVEGP